MLVGPAAVVFGSRALSNKGHLVAASVLAALLALPRLLDALFMLVAVTSGMRWT